MCGFRNTAAPVPAEHDVRSFRAMAKYSKKILADNDFPSSDVD